MVCSKYLVVDLYSLPLGLRSSLSSSGALEEECYAYGFTDTASGSAYSSLSSSGALEEACCANIFEKNKNNSLKTPS